MLTYDVHMIELAIQASARIETHASESMIMACRKLIGEIDELADMVLPEMTDEEKAVIAAALNGRQP